MKLHEGQTLRANMGQTQRSANRTDPAHHRCLLCGKSRLEVKKLILGVHGGVCLDCVALCNDIIAADELKVGETKVTYPE